MLAMDVGFMGPNYSISTACATGNYCIHTCVRGSCTCVHGTARTKHFVRACTCMCVHTCDQCSAHVIVQCTWDARGMHEALVGTCEERIRTCTQSMWPAAFAPCCSTCARAMLLHLCTCHAAPPVHAPSCSTCAHGMLLHLCTRHAAPPVRAQRGGACAPGRCGPHAGRCCRRGHHPLRHGRLHRLQGAHCGLWTGGSSSRGAVGMRLKTCRAACWRKAAGTCALKLGFVCVLKQGGGSKHSAI